MVSLQVFVDPLHDMLPPDFSATGKTKVTKDKVATKTQPCASKNIMDI
jgi:hypothetical protein